jgi:metal-sulfur cluster biosynthetic enzyme
VSTRESVIEALGEVHDPELDEPITALGFVTSVEVEDGEAVVVLRLPTPQCAPNFAYLMAADARNCVRRLPNVRRVTIRLEDHYTGEEINTALQRGDGFTGAFPGETDDDQLDALRELFFRKALVARQSRVCEGLLAAGATAEEVAGLHVADLDLDREPEARRCLELRRQLGIARDRDAPAFVLPDGAPIVAGELQRWLRTARLVSTSLDVNGGICRSLLEFRQGLADDREAVSR